MTNKVWRLIFWLFWPLVWIYSPIKTRSRLLVVHGSEFLVVKPYFGSGLWQLPGGGIKFGESPQSAAARELYEEAGIKVEANSLRPLRSIQSYFENGLTKRYIIFSTEVKSTKSERIKDREIIDLAWMPLSGPLLDCASHVKLAVDSYRPVPVK